MQTEAALFSQRLRESGSAAVKRASPADRVHTVTLHSTQKANSIQTDHDHK